MMRRVISLTFSSSKLVNVYDKYRVVCYTEEESEDKEVGPARRFPPK